MVKVLTVGKFQEEKSVNWNAARKQGNYIITESVLISKEEGENTT